MHQPTLDDEKHDDQFCSPCPVPQHCDQPFPSLLPQLLVICPLPLAACCDDSHSHCVFSCIVVVVVVQCLLLLSLLSYCWLEIKFSCNFLIKFITCDYFYKMIFNNQALFMSYDSLPDYFLGSNGQIKPMYLLRKRLCDDCACFLRRKGVKQEYHKINSARIDRAAQDQADKIRNIGIIAHIDAGKTTLTEQFLYLAGKISTLGAVDDGSTVTDFMEIERERGITIQSAALSLPWCDHKINLVDTPGHIDFTVEVERCLRVLDGAITVLDGSAGVQAQTLSVWRQAKKNSLPSIFFVNKMDKPGADFNFSMASIEERLKTKVVPVVVPYNGQDGRLAALIDGII